MSGEAEIRQVAVDHHHEVAGRFVDYYDKMENDRFSTAFSYGRHKVDVILFEMLGALPEGAAVLDIGCGTGPYIARIEKMGLKAHGIEPAEAMRAVAVRDNPSSDIRDGLATALPFDDASLDFVMAIEVYRYLSESDFAESMQECMRVLRPGGRVFFTMVNKYALDGFYLLQRLRQGLRGVSYDNAHPHCTFYTPGDVRDVLSTAGFEEVETIDRLFGPMRMAYKLSESLGAKLARKVEPLDDLLSAQSFMSGLGGHLIGTATRPR